MPLTFAHPAAVLPGHRWLRRWIPFPALVIGSMSPDFEYFLRLEPVGHFGHRALGILLFCLPSGLMVYALYQKVIAPALPTLLPSILVGRWTKATSESCHGWWGVPVGIILGAITHIVWDNFTHGTGALVTHFSILQSTVVTIPLYKILQHGSTLFGLTIILVWVRSLPIRDLPTRPWPLREFGLPGLIIFFVAWTLFACIRIPDTPGRVVVGLIDAGFIALFVSSLHVLCKKASAAGNWTR